MGVALRNISHAQYRNLLYWRRRACSLVVPKRLRGGAILHCPAPLH